MSTDDPTVLEGPGTQYDAPNQQVVRADGSTPWDEGSGGSEEAETPDPFEAMTKEELIAYCEAHGIDYPVPGVKADIRAAIEAHEGSVN